jgi:hypothetical protein
MYENHTKVNGFCDNDSKHSSLFLIYSTNIGYHYRSYSMAHMIDVPRIVVVFIARATQYLRKTIGHLRLEKFPVEFARGTRGTSEGLLRVWRFM